LPRAKAAAQPGPASERSLSADPKLFEKPLFCLALDSGHDLHMVSRSSTWKIPAELFIAISMRTARSSPAAISTRSIAAAEIA
jgi:hypothetical protein